MGAGRVRDVEELVSAGLDWLVASAISTDDGPVWTGRAGRTTHRCDRPSLRRQGSGVVDADGDPPP